MSVEKQIAYNGQIVYWSLTDGTNVDVLRDGFSAIGKAHLIPETQADNAALKRAIASVFSDKRTLVRPLSGVVGYAVVHEDPSGDEMEYEEEARFALLDGELYSNPLDHPANERISEIYSFERKLVTASKLGGVLVRAARELDGIPLRPRGGAYWIPDHQADAWENIVNVVESSRHGNVTWKLRTTTDENTVNAVCDSLITEVEKEIESLTEEIQEGDLGERGIKNREKKAQELDALVSRYEKRLGKTLTQVKEQIAEVEKLAVAALLDSMVA